MIFDKEAYIAKMKPSVDKLLAQLQKKGVTFTPKDAFDNVTFSTDSKSIKMSEHSFYRFSGISCVYKEKGDGEKKTFDIIEVTDEMFLQNFMRPIIEMHLDIKGK